MCEPVQENNLRRKFFDMLIKLVFESKTYQNTKRMQINIQMSSTLQYDIFGTLCLKYTEHTLARIYYSNVIGSTKRRLVDGAVGVLSASDAVP